MESVSTLMDGELNVDDAAREIARFKSDAGMRENWDAYHLIGDVMRGASAGERGFTARVSEQLALEATVLAPPAAGRAPRLTRKFQNYALAAAASVAAVTVVSWVALNPVKSDMPVDIARLQAAPAQQPQQQLAVVPAPAAAEQQPMSLAPAASDVQQAAVPAERMHEYLLAHQGISPTTAIQGVTPYIRTVSGSGE